MRRRGVTVIIIAVLAAAFVGTWTVAYRLGESDGRNKVSTDRSTFQTRVASGPQAGAGGNQAAGGGFPGGGGAAVPAGARGPGGSAVTGGGPQPTGAVGTGGSPAAGRGAGTVSSITGKVTKVDGATLSVQQGDSATISVTTTAETAVRKLVVGALTDLKAGDIVTIDGTKTGDTAVSARSVTNLGSVPGGGGAGGPGGGRGQGGPPAGGVAPAVTGQIKSVDGGTLTVQGFDGTSVTVSTTPGTVVRMQQPGALSDIKSGDTLVIQGDKTGDTAFLARTITNQGTSG